MHCHFISYWWIIYKMINKFLPIERACEFHIKCIIVQIRTLRLEAACYLTFSELISHTHKYVFDLIKQKLHVAVTIIHHNKYKSNQTSMTIIFIISDLTMVGFGSFSSSLSILLIYFNGNSWIQYIFIPSLHYIFSQPLLYLISAFFLIDDK